MTTVQQLINYWAAGSLMILVAVPLIGAFLLWKDRR